MITAINEAINRKLASISFTTIINGIVESIDPLQIRINSRIVIGTDFIEPKSLGLSDYSPGQSLPLIVGEKIQMVRYNNGQRFYILGKTAGGAGGDYNGLENKPHLDTTSTLPLEEKDEVIEDTVFLHKVAKSGSFSDLSNKPDLDKYVKSTDGSIKNWKTYTPAEFERLKEDGGLVVGEVYNVLDENLGAMTSVPVGMGTIWWGKRENLPANYMYAEGQSLLKADYPTLYAIIGDWYGGDDTHFNLPDVSGKVVVHPDGSVEFPQPGYSGGEKTHKLTVDEMPKHEHNIEPYKGVGGYGSAGHTGILAQTASTSFNNYYATSTGGDGEHNNLQPYRTGYYVIKALEEAGTENVRNLDNQVQKLRAEVADYDEKFDEAFQEAFYGKSAIMLKQTTLINWTGTGTPTRFAFQTEAFRSGEGLTKVNNQPQVVVGKNVKKVRATAHIQTNEAENAAQWLMAYIRKNDTGVIRGIASLEKWNSVHLEAYIDVTEGDILDVAVASDSTASIVFPVYDSFIYGNVGISSFLVEEVR